MSEYEYDKSGVSSSLLAISLLTPLLLATAPFVFRTRKERHFDCTCARCKEVSLQRKRTRGSRLPKYAFFGMLLLLFVPLKVVVLGGYGAEGRFDPYRVLGVGRSANKTEIRKSYRVLIREAKMMKGDPETKNQRIQEVLAAHKTLSNDKMREAWDAFGDASQKSLRK